MTLVKHTAPHKQKTYVTFDHGANTLMECAMFMNVAAARLYCGASVLSDPTLVYNGIPCHIAPSGSGWIDDDEIALTDKHYNIISRATVAPYTPPAPHPHRYIPPPAPRPTASTIGGKSLWSTNPYNLPTEEFPYD